MCITKESRSKLRDIYAYISENLYYSRSDLHVQNESANATLLLILFTALTGGKALVVGEPGLGKTTAAEYVCSLVYGFPLGVIWSSVVGGHPEQTEEKIVGRPDLGRLNQGEEVVIWSLFARLPVKIVDEINRLPETKQSLVLDGVERGKWEYLNQSLINDEFCLFATANYQDQGTNTLVPPLLDRFDVILESKHPGANIASLIGQEASREFILRHAPSEADFLEILHQGCNGKSVSLEQARQRFAKEIQQKCGLSLLTPFEREALRHEIATLEVDLAANAFIRMALSELSFCCKYGQKRSGEVCDDGCHYSGYLCYQITNCASNRLPNSIYRYARTLAWWLGNNHVDVEHVRLILPYAIAHRIQWRESYLLMRERERRSEPLQLHAARHATGEIFRRFHEQRHEVMQALSTAAHIMDDADLIPPMGDHPLYADIQRDLGLEPSS
jgi:hypothetical protein